MLPRLQGFSLGFLLVTAGLIGCASVRRPEPPSLSLEVVRSDVAAGHGHLVETVPFVGQMEYQCGPAALAMVLQHYGARVEAEEIARRLDLPSARGVLNLELEFYARRLGFRTRAFQGTLDRAKSELRGGRPLIVFQDLGAIGPDLVVTSVPHFAVLLGYDDRAGVVVLHSGTTPYRLVSYADFERTWRAGRGWTLLVTPAGRARESLPRGARPNASRHGSPPTA
jgi:ABC-type bacteriocin/lantibiotic exporter with double-glycine peptidase domain